MKVKLPGSVWNNPGYSSLCKSAPTLEKGLRKISSIQRIGNIRILFNVLIGLSTLHGDSTTL